MGLNLNWTKCQGDVWCDFMRLNLEHPHFYNLKGVYVIWSGKNTVYVGSGIIKDRIAAHRTEISINTYINLRVVWAEVNEEQMQGVERYLADKLSPLEGEKHPNVTPISVNLPWG